MDEKELIIQDWKDYGIEKNIFQQFINRLENEKKRLFSRGWAKIIVPVEGDNYGEVKEVKVFVRHSNESKEELLDSYFERVYHFLERHMPPSEFEWILERTNRSLLEMAGQIDVMFEWDETPPEVIIAVGGFEKRIPHFHVFRNKADCKSWKKGACLLMSENLYYDHVKNKETLTREELDMVIKKLKAPSPLTRFQCSNWEFILILWNSSNENLVDPSLKMPDYDYYTITRYKDTGKLRSRI
jgi:hypothetical protein